MNGDKYLIFDDGKRLPSGGPLKGEYYGPSWDIGAHGTNSPVVIVPDPGDGSAEPLARKILSLLNSNPVV